jgi:hypothetical protein
MVACCAACQSEPSTPKALQTTRDRNQAFLNTVARDCRLPAQTFNLIGDDQVQMQPAPDANYQSVDCALEKLLPKKDLHLGFVGNEYFANEVQ